jgi:hypothetical protein
MSSDTQFTALGPTDVGFQTNGANINTGVHAVGNATGVVGRCQGGNGYGVHGTGAGAWAGVAGIGGRSGGTGVWGIGGLGGGQGVCGIGGGGPNTEPSTPVGVYGQAGPDADGVQGIGAGASGGGVHGISNDENGNGLIGDAHRGTSAYAVWGRSNSGFAGYFDGRVRVAGDLETYGDLTVGRNLTVRGVKSAAVALADGSLRLLYAVESPESWFEDVGFGELVDGHASITLDPTFAAVVETQQYHVFLTEYDAHNGLAVTNRTSTGFEVRSADAKASGSFSYRVTARRADVSAQRFAQHKPPQRADGPAKPAEVPPAPRIADNGATELPR